jgi:acetylornithine deacetylase/succinyl-diaminopimelate desuccinylase-like protein
VDNLIRFREEGFKPKRSIKLALTCGEETNGALNGAEWLTKHERAAIDAEFAITEGTDGILDAQGRKVAFEVLAAEKTSQNYVFEATNAGGHSSRPLADNAIYHVARAVDKVGQYEFPVQLDDANRGYFSGMAKITGGEDGAAMLAVLKNPEDRAAVAVLDKNVDWHAMLRTTCVATMFTAGHATNALPQRARANINCRIFPGMGIEDVRQTLVRLVADPEIAVTTIEPSDPVVPPPPLTAAIMKPIEEVTRRMYPGIEVVPVLQAAGTDAIYLAGAGIPTYGVSGMFVDPDLSNVHGLNERLRVQSLYDGRDFLFSLVKIYADQTR